MRKLVCTRDIAAAALCAMPGEGAFSPFILFVDALWYLFCICILAWSRVILIKTDLDHRSQDPDHHALAYWRVHLRASAIAPCSSSFQWRATFSASGSSGLGADMSAWMLLALALALWCWCRGVVL